MGRRADEEVLLDLVPPGRSIGNKPLLRALQGRSWSEEKYWKVRDQLIAKGVLVARKGRGGSVRRVESSQPASIRQEPQASSGESGSTPGGTKQRFPVLEHVRFIDWKSFGDATLHIDPLTVLIGTNASGKSNALDGLQFLNRIAHAKDISVALAGDLSLAALRGGIEGASAHGATGFSFEVEVRSAREGTEYHYQLSVEITAQAQLSEEYLERVLRDPETNEVRDRVMLIRTELPGLDDPTITVHIHDGAGGISRSIPRNTTLLSQPAYLLPSAAAAAALEVSHVLKSIFVLDPIPSRMREYSHLAEDLSSDASNIAGVLAALPLARRGEVESTLTRYVRGLPERDIIRVWSENIGKFQRDAMLYCEESWIRGGPATVVDARLMSDGTLRMLAILTALLTRPEGSVLVIEEVDNGLHPSRSGLLLRMLRELGENRHIDVLVTTHNPALLDSLGPEMVPFVVVAHRDPESGESVLTLLEELDALPRLMAAGSLGRLSAEGQIERSLEQEARSRQEARS